MATATAFVETTQARSTQAPTMRPQARWVPVTDEQGRRRLVMQWHVPGADEAPYAIAAAGS